MPRAAIEPLAVTRAGPGTWKVRWRVTNDGEPLLLTAIAAPHGKFRSRDHAIDVSLASGASFEPQLEIACAEPAGTEIENTFLILTAEAAANFLNVPPAQGPGEASLACSPDGQFHLIWYH